MSTPINLRSEFGHRWKIGLDEAAGGRWKDAWHFMVVCRHGVIVPWGGDLLGASTHHGGAIARRLVRLPGVEVIHDGDDGATVVCHRHELRVIAGLLKPRRAPRASTGQPTATEHDLPQRQCHA